MNEQSQFSREFSIIPTWARVLAVIGFALVQVCLLVLLPHFSQHMHGDMPPRGIMSLISIVGGLVFAIFLLLIGYVNVDSKRRGMNQTLWTLLVIFIPKAIGFLAYFLLRKPLLVPGSPNCPRCSTAVGPDFRFCPKCGYAFAPSCANCGRAINPDYVCCPYCGKNVGSAMPQQAPQPS
jgi:hypothetical protein